MVWSQYRTWASEGTEVETSANNSDDDRNEDDPYLNINTFYDSYSDQLQFLYDMFRNMIHQAYLDEPTSDFSDFLDILRKLESGRTHHASLDNLSSP